MERGFTVEETRAPALLEQVYALRALAWREKDGVRAPGHVVRWRDAHDAHARHLVALAPDGQVLGAVRLCLHPTLEESVDGAHFAAAAAPLAPPFWSWTRLAVHPAARGRGVSGALDAAALAAFAAQPGTVLGVVEVGSLREGMLQRLGLVRLGDFALERPFGRGGPERMTLARYVLTPGAPARLAGGR